LLGISFPFLTLFIELLLEPAAVNDSPSFCLRGFFFFFFKSTDEHDDDDDEDEGDEPELADEDVEEMDELDEIEDDDELELSETFSSSSLPFCLCFNFLLFLFFRLL